MLIFEKDHVVFRCKTPLGALSPRPNSTEQKHFSKRACYEKRRCRKPKMCIPRHIIASSLLHNVLAFWPRAKLVGGQQPGCSVPSILCLLLCGRKKGLFLPWISALQVWCWCFPCSCPLWLLSSGERGERHHFLWNRRLWEKAVSALYSSISCRSAWGYT